MIRFGAFGLVIAAALALTACSLFSSPPSSAPSQSGYYDNDLHGNYPGPGANAQNRE